MKNFVLQIDQTDCGVACLLSLIRYYGGENTIENLRRISGTAITGTTLLGLKEAAESCGFTADGCEADMASLIEHNKPCILHVMAGQLQHYVICFGTYSKNDRLVFKIGDPAKGIVYMTEREVDTLWQSKVCLTLELGPAFTKAETITRDKRKWVWQLLKEDMLLLYTAAGLGIAISLLGIVMALFSQKLIDDILPKRDFIKLNVGIALVLLLLLMKEATAYFRQYFLLRQAYAFNTRIVDFFYTRLLQLPKRFFDSRKTGELTARLNDTARIQKVISQIAGNAIIDTLMVLTATVFVFMYSWQVGLICLLALPVFFLIIYRFNTGISDAQRNVMGAYANAEANYISTLQSIDTIQNYNRQYAFASLNKTIYNNYQEHVLSLGKIQIRLSLFANMYSVVFLIGVILYTSYSVLNGHLKTGELMAILSMCATLLPSTANLALLSIPFNEAKIAFDRMFEFVLETPKVEHEANLPITSIDSIELQNVCFRYPGRRLLLHNVSFTLRKGEIIALVGKNGSGKSTLLQILLRHYAPAAGKIIVNNGVCLEKISDATWRSHVADVPQQVHLFNGTVLENIAFEDAVSNTSAVLQFLQEYGFAPFIETLPNSYMTLAGEEGVNLSGGQKQIIALARALYKKPQLLILDEATAAMDMNVEVFVSQLLRRIKQDIAVVLVTHKPDLMNNLADDVIILKNFQRSLK